MTTSRPAFYALAPGGWRDYVTLLHPPYTLWHLSYVAIGAALAPDLEVGRLLAALAAFFLAVGIGAHALDELKGHPLHTRISDRALMGLAAVSIGGAVAIGVYASIAYTPWLAPLVVVGGFIVCAYNLELFGGAFHSDAWFALAWGAFPLLTAYVAAAERLTVEARRRRRLRRLLEPCATSSVDAGANRPKARCGRQGRSSSTTGRASR